MTVAMKRIPRVGPCAVGDCHAPIFARGFCKKHYDRKLRHGDPTVCKKAMVARGLPMSWIHDHVGYTGDDCLIWPFAKHPDGRAHMKAGKPARIMCGLAHGDPPSRLHEAAHSCGRGHGGCVNPRHLRWATPIENASDKFTHGTVVQGERHWSSKLTEDDVRSIRAQYGAKTMPELAKQYGVRISAIHKIIHRNAWRHVA